MTEPPHISTTWADLEGTVDVTGVVLSRQAREANRRAYWAAKAEGRFRDGQYVMVDGERVIRVAATMQAMENDWDAATRTMVSIWDNAATRPSLNHYWTVVGHEEAKDRPAECPSAWTV